jgi:valyl-tRNA synthetase
MAEAAAKVVEDGDIKISPESARKSYLRWMANVNDWCISRQLWFVPPRIATAFTC